MKRWLPLTLLALVLACAPSPSEAHLVNTRLGDFYGGMLHPLTGFEYILPWLALAILAAFQGVERGRWLLLVFPLSLLIGTELSLLLPHLTFVPLLNIVTIASLGLLVALAIRLPLSAFIALAAVIGLAQGYENGRAMAWDTDHLLFMTGVTAMGYVLITLATAVLFVFIAGHGGWRPIALRAGGSWIAAVGIMVFSFELVRAGSVAG